MSRGGKWWVHTDPDLWPEDESDVQSILSDYASDEKGNDVGDCR